jgi:hypothetical protein
MTIYLVLLQFDCYECRGPNEVVAAFTSEASAIKYRDHLLGAIDEAKNLNRQFTTRSEVLEGKWVEIPSPPYSTYRKYRKLQEEIQYATWAHINPIELDNN